MSFKKNLFAVSLLSSAIIGVSNAGSYSYTTGMLILDRVKVQTLTENYYAQFSLHLSEQNGTFTGLGILPLTDSFPSADATLTFDITSNNYILTVLNASGYYGVLTAASINGPYTTSNIISVQANIVGATGPKGDTGATGPKGDKGDTGATGATGPKGDTGTIGDTGPKGDTGAPGQNGTNGKDGADGLTTSVNGVTQVNGAITLTKANIGLGNVDNTTDANKPISTATQTALALKAPLDDPDFTGTPSAPTAASGTNTNQIATTAFVKTVHPDGSTVGDMLYWDGANWKTVPAYNGTNSNPSLYFCNSKPQWQPCKTYAIGDIGPSGTNTTVFFVDGSGLHGLEAQNADDGSVSWSNAISVAMSHGQGWHLPTKTELELLYEQKAVVGGFADNAYWSSTKVDVDNSWLQFFHDGAVYTNSINDSYLVRAVRIF